MLPGEEEEKKEEEEEEKKEEEEKEKEKEEEEEKVHFLLDLALRVPQAPRRSSNMFMWEVLRIMLVCLRATEYYPCLLPTCQPGAVGAEEAWELMS